MQTKKTHTHHIKSKQPQTATTPPKTKQNNTNPLTKKTHHQPSQTKAATLLATDTTTNILAILTHNPNTPPPHTHTPVVATRPLAIGSRVGVGLLQSRAGLPARRLPRVRAQRPQAANQRRKARRRGLVAHPRQPLLRVGIVERALFLNGTRRKRQQRQIEGNGKGQPRRFP